MLLEFGSARAVPSVVEEKRIYSWLRYAVREAASSEEMSFDENTSDATDYDSDSIVQRTSKIHRVSYLILFSCVYKFRQCFIANTVLLHRKGFETLRSQTR